MRFLMCAPDHFGVEYVINPWMRDNEGAVVRAEARDQWRRLHGLLTETFGARVDLVTPQPGLPDMVFTANAGQVWGRRCVPSRFRPVERQGEEPHFRAWFAAEGFEVADLPGDLRCEGAGDALFDGGRPPDAPLLWAAHGFRTDRAAHEVLGAHFGAEVVSLCLADPRYYHLDTCFCPLPGGALLWYPPAFDATSQEAIAARVSASRRFAVGDADAEAFACNAVAVGEDAVVLNAASPELRGWLAGRGFAVHATPLTEFMRAGGAAKCLTLRLD